MRHLVRAKTFSWGSRFVYASAITAWCTMLAACGGAGGAPAATSSAAPTSTGSGASAAGFPVTVENCGHTLTFDKSPSRVVLPYQPQAEMVVGLGQADRVVGRVGWSGGIKDPPFAPEQAADFARIPVVSDKFYPPPKEKMLSLRPDFLLTYGDFDLGGKAQGADGLATYDELKTAGVQTYTVVCPDPEGKYTNETLDASYRSILDLGKIFGVRDRAEQQVAQMKAQIADVSQKVSGQPKLKVLAYYTGKGPLSLASGKDGIATQIIEAAGGENVFADQDPYFQASLEAVAGKQVDAFLILTNSKLTAAEQGQFLTTTFPNMKASKDHRVIAIDQMFVTPGWRNAQTVEELARQLHPDAFK